MASWFKNYWFSVPVMVIAAGALFFWMGGAALLKGRLKK
jgi:hypothetical protein